MKRRNKIQAHVFKENVKCTFQEKLEKNHILHKSAQHISDKMDPENLEDELRSLLVANNEVDVSIAVNSEQLEKEQELSEIKTKKQELIINLQKKNEVLWELIIKAKFILNKRMKLWQLYRENEQYARKLLKSSRQQWLNLNFRRARYQ